MLISDKLKSFDFTYAEKEIVKYFLNQKEEIARQSTREISKRLYCSPSSIIRLCQKLGFTGFEEFKEMYVEELHYLNSNFSDINPSIPFMTEDNIQTISNKMCSLYHEIIDDTHSLLDHDMLRKSLNLLKNNKNIYIIFTTAHLEYGLMAYRYKTFDYLPKPVSVERLEVTISRLLEDIADTPCKYLKLANSNTFLTYDSIYFIKKDGMKLIFQTHEKIYSSYDSFANILPSLPTNFVRCHKSYIVNINNIQNIVNDRIMFCNNLVCYIGPKYKNTFEEVLSHGNIPNNLDSTNYAK